jgi:hypothetical protein
MSFSWGRIVKSKSEPLWPHLRYVTLSDIREELPGPVMAWVILSAFSCAVDLAIDRGSSYVHEWKSPLPGWADASIVTAVVFWFLRGQRINYRFPMLSLAAWVGFSLSLGLLFYVSKATPFWIAIPFYVGMIVIVAMLDALEAHGRENFEAFKAARGEPRGV